MVGVEEKSSLTLLALKAPAPPGRHKAPTFGSDYLDFRLGINWALGLPALKLLYAASVVILTTEYKAIAIRTHAAWVRSDKYICTMFSS